MVFRGVLHKIIITKAKITSKSINKYLLLIFYCYLFFSSHILTVSVSCPETGKNFIHSSLKDLHSKKVHVSDQFQIVRFYNNNDDNANHNRIDDTEENLN